MQESKTAGLGDKFVNFTKELVKKTCSYEINI